MKGLPAGERWSVVLASRAVKELRKLHKDQNALEITWKKLRELSAGQFSPDNHKAIIGTIDMIPIYRARLSNDLIIIYQIDLTPDSSNVYDHQVVKVLVINSRAHIDYGFWTHVSSTLYHRPNKDAYREKCITRLPRSADSQNNILPTKFPHDPKHFIHDPAPLSVHSSTVEAKYLDEANAMIGLERYLPASKALYNSIIANMELNFPFVLDSHEREIVNHRGASIVVGRSGTGKTTALIYKMRAINQELSELHKKKKCQLFVTRSPVLARHVESNFRGLIDSVNISNKTPEELAEMARSAGDRPACALIDFDNEVDLRKDLPSRYSLLEKTHFPLFVSFEKLCSLIEADLLRYEKLKQLWKQQDDLIAAEEPPELEVEGKVALERAEDPFRALLLRQQDRRLIRLIEEKKYIGYSDFKERYWPQFKKTYDPQITPALAYSEMLGVIKGSSESISSSKRYLSKEQYLSGLVRRVSAQLDVRLREQIYDIFEQYKKLIGASFELDVADRTHYLLEFMNDINAIELADSDSGSDSHSNHGSEPDSDSNEGEEEPDGQEASGVDDQEDSGRGASRNTVDNTLSELAQGLQIEKPSRKSFEKFIRAMASSYQEPVEYLYVDEVQDNIMIDIHFLNTLCESVQNTYWGGDTAQTIVAGSAFRIKDLGAHLYKQNELEIRLPHLDTGPSPSQFKLTVNFRSQDGIVQCAASIVQKLYELFPHSLDKMEPESGRSSGSLPVVFTDANSDIFLFEQFLLKSSPSSGMMFGAQQAILVRTDVEAEELYSILSERCPVLTIADSKGLEFEDILIYNFFSTSQLPLDAWDFVHGRPIKVHRSQRDVSPPPSLCNDLKLLYVALTRARKRCWIWDHGYVVDAMRYFWLSQDLVTTASISEMTGWNTVASTPTQWIQKGREYFSNGNYKLARGCFLRGEDKLQANIAEAYHEMTRAKLEAARSIPVTDENKSKLREAAQKLKNCAVASDHVNARNLWFHAGNCLELARKINEASAAYVHAELYERAIRLLLVKERFSVAVPILIEHKDKLECDIREEMLDQCRVHYIQASDYDSLRPLFNDTSELLTFTIQRGYRSQYTTFLDHNKRFYQLAKVYLEQNSPLRALDYLLKEFNLRGEQQVLNEASQLVLTQSEWVLALDRSRNYSATRTIDDMMQVIRSYTSKLTIKARKELTLAKDILDGTVHLRMVDDWKSDKITDKLWRARILHSVLQDKTWLGSRFETGIIRHLDAWADYVGILAPIIEATEPSRLSSTQRLLGFKPSGTGVLISPKMIVAEWSIIASAAQRFNTPTQQNQYGELLVSSSWVDRLVKSEFVRPLQKRLFEIYSGLKKCGWTSPRRFLPRSTSINSSRYITRATTSDEKFATRIRVITAAIQVFSPLRRIPCRTNSLTSTLHYRWVRRLFDALYPCNGMMEESTTISAETDSPIVKSVQACVEELILPSSLRISTNTGISAPSSDPDFSTCVMGYSLSLHFPLGLSLLSSTGVSATIKSLIGFFEWSDSDGLTKGCSTLRGAFKDSEPLDAVLMVHFIEMITCDIIYHSRKAASYTKDGFSGLILPFSWARSLAKRYSQSNTSRDTDCLDELLSLINMLSNRLKDKEAERWFIGRESLSNRPEMVHILNLRLCWCVALLVVNSLKDSAFGFIDMAVEVLSVSAQDWWLHKPAPLFSRFTTVMDQSSCLETLCETLNHETLVRLSNGWESVPYWKKQSSVLVITFMSPADLTRSLQRAIRS